MSIRKSKRFRSICAALPANRSHRRSAGYALAAKQPKITFKKDSWDFGKIKQGDEPAYEFVFKNEATPS